MSEVHIEYDLAEILSESPSAPFLFIGSGFSRRYINMPDWKGLLAKFSSKPFQMYLSKSNGKIPLAALKLAEAYHDDWWQKNEKYSEIYESEYWDDKIETPLKYDIAEYLLNYPIDQSILENAELSELTNEKVVIDGIITTNWDILLERIFPKLKVYIGQSDILFKHPQAVGEIFKIHGCCTKFNSLVLSSRDYENFNEKNPYLAAKLISIFLEKPVIFIGYSISDENIIDILEKIEKVVDSEDKIQKLSKNMIFVNRANGSSDKLSNVAIPINGKRITFTHIETDDFGQVFRALQHAERKIPVEFLRVFKDQIYNIVNSREKADLRLKYVDFENIIEGEDIEFVAGMGVKSISDFGERGLKGLECKDLIKDIVFDHLNIPKETLSTIVLEIVKHNRTYTPIRKYIRSIDEYKNTENKSINTRLGYSSEDYKKKTPSFSSIIKHVSEVKDCRDLLNDNIYDITHDADKLHTLTNKKLDSLSLWLYLNKDKESCEKIRYILKENYGEWIANNTWNSFKRLVCMLDEIENNDIPSQV